MSGTHTWRCFDIGVILGFGMWGDYLGGILNLFSCYNRFLLGSGWKQCVRCTLFFPTFAVAWHCRWNLCVFGWQRAIGSEQSATLSILDGVNGPL